MAAGNIWRAKEILQGRLAGAGYDCELFLKYGEVLQQMGDLRLAGKFLFLSGHRKPEYRESIDTFLRSDCKGTFSNFWGKMPKAAHNAAAADIPLQVLNELFELGFQRQDVTSVLASIEADLEDRRSRKENALTTTSGSNWGPMIIVSAIVLLLIGLLYQAVVGLVAITGFLLKGLF